MIFYQIYLFIRKFNKIKFRDPFWGYHKEDL